MFTAKFVVFEVILQEFSLVNISFESDFVGEDGQKPFVTFIIKYNYSRHKHKLNLFSSSKIISGFSADEMERIK